MGIRDRGIDLAANAIVIRLADCFREAVRVGAAAVVLAHNHPSGDPTPSPEDVRVTREAAQVGDLLGIEVLDHVVISSGPGNFVSLRERGFYRPASASTRSKRKTAATTMRARVRQASKNCSPRSSAENQIASWGEGSGAAEGGCRSYLHRYCCFVPSHANRLGPVPGCAILSAVEDRADHRVPHASHGVAPSV